MVCGVIIVAFYTILAYNTLGYPYYTLNVAFIATL